jgi:mannose-1-phosphate guanylyltransferase
MRYAMIMAGGAGTRLWPLSRLDRPKQLLPFIVRPQDDAGSASQGEPVSLLSLAADRLDGVVEPGRRYICTGESYREAIAAALPAFTHTQILGEPTGRDTVNAVGFTAAVLDKRDPDAIFAVFTADHIIEPIDTFRSLIDLGFRLVEQDATRLVTFSIKPTYAATGFGYVERGRAIPGLGENDAGLAFDVARFVEKPDEHRAQAYLDSGHFGWNSGMFVWRASTVMQCLKRFKPECYDGLKRIQAAWGTADQDRVLNEVYPTLPKVSIDYALMEPASQVPSGDEDVRVATVLMDLTWLDVGSWPSYAQTLEADGDGNRVIQLGLPDSGAANAADRTTDHPPAALTVDSTNNLIVNADDSESGHTIALLGCEGLVVVRTPDATLIMPADKAERLKALHAKAGGRLQ